MKKSGAFRFKRFTVEHDRSSMKVGVDGVSLACWANVAQSRRILDVGTGCGVIALICAQRSPEAFVEGIDIDSSSVEEAANNFRNSPFGERLEAKCVDFISMPADAKWDHIVSNPPFFDSGMSSAESARIAARHQLLLNIESLLEKAAGLLSDAGRLSVVLPTDMLPRLKNAAEKNGLQLSRLTYVKGHPNARAKRILAELSVSSVSAASEDELVMMDSEGNPTEHYRRLCADFYLKF